MSTHRIRNASLNNKTMTADEAVKLIKDGMKIGMSEFTLAGNVKEVPIAMPNNLVEFFKSEVKHGRLDVTFNPLQAGIGTIMVNGIGGACDFARNALISIFVTKSIAKGGKIYSVVPMVTRVDHTEHDVDVTEVGLTDLRGLALRECAQAVIDNCVASSFKAKLQDYFDRVCKCVVVKRPISWRSQMIETGNML